VGARAISLVTDRPESGPFSLSWRGYDRAEVDAFLERTAADRQRLQADLAQLEAALSGCDAPRHRELERLAALRSELARCLETSINALHLANLLLVSPDLGADADGHPHPAGGPGRSGRSQPQPAWPLPGWLSPARTLTLIAVVAATAATLSALGPAPQVAPSDLQPVIQATAAPVLDARPPTAIEPVTKPPPAASPVAPATDGLVLALTALGDCWIRSTLDGGEPRERLLKLGDALTLRADDDVELRVGDPAALLLEINDRPAKPLGAAGRVVRARITRTNYLSFLSGS